jgi:hypothetical protein
MLKATRRGGPTTPGEPGKSSDLNTQMIPHRREKRKPVLPRGCFALWVPPLTAALGLAEDARPWTFYRATTVVLRPAFAA